MATEGMSAAEFRRVGARIATLTPEASTRDWRKGLAQRTKLTLEEIDGYAQGRRRVPAALAARLRALLAETGPQEAPAGSAPPAPKTPGEAAGRPTLGGVPETNQPIPAKGGALRRGRTPER